MSEYDFHTIEIAVAKLKINYPTFNFLLFCESSRTGQRGIVDLGVHSRTKGYSKHTFVVPLIDIAPTDANAYYAYFRDALVEQNRIPPLVNMTLGYRQPRSAS